MDQNKSFDLPQRHRPAHLPLLDVGTRSNLVFVTVCTNDRSPVLASERMHNILRETWRIATHWQVGRYVIMPNHVHLFCAPNRLPAESLVLWVRYWKRLVTQASDRADIRQKNFWDTQLRRHESYGSKWEYVRQNPVRAGLVTNPDHWPYQGELNVLSWIE